MLGNHWVFSETIVPKLSNMFWSGHDLLSFVLRPW